jgi:hypothetical protein
MGSSSLRFGLAPALRAAAALLALFAWVAFGMVGRARAQDVLPVPPLEGRVIDRTDTLSAQQRQAMEINNTVVQGLSVAKYAFDEGQVETGRRAVEQTLERAQQIICDLLEDALAELGAGDFRRDARVTLNGE